MFQMYVGYLFMVLLIQWGLASLFLFIFNNPFWLAHCQKKPFGRSPKKEVSWGKKHHEYQYNLKDNDNNRWKHKKEKTPIQSPIHKFICYMGVMVVVGYERGKKKVVWKWQSQVFASFVQERCWCSCMSHIEVNAMMWIQSRIHTMTTTITITSHWHHHLCIWSTMQHMSNKVKKKRSLLDAICLFA
jgi:hypothetical protein